MPVLEFVDNTLADISPDLLGVWTTVPLSSPEAVAFSTPGRASSDIPLDTAVWRVNLPDNLNAARATMAEARVRLEASRNKIEQAPVRLESCLQKQAEGVSFDTSSSPKGFMTQAEAELFVSLNAIQTGQVPISFGLGDRLTGGLREAAEQFRIFFERFMKSVAQYAWVETCVQGHYLGRTSVSWTGDMNTVWRRNFSPIHVELHRNTLVLVLKSKDEVLRMVSLAIQGAFRLSMLLAAPGSAILALPAVWRFMNQILKETS